MNKTEQDYARLLDTLKDCGAVLEYWFEGITFTLANRTRYTPDFLVQLSDRTMECHEVKGFWQDDARVKIKVAAELFYPFQFVAMQPIPKSKGGGWKREAF